MSTTAALIGKEKAIERVYSMNGNSPEKDSYKFKVSGLILPTITANTRPIDSSSPTSSLGRCAHIPLDPPCVFAMEVPLEFTQDEPGVCEFWYRAVEKSSRIALWESEA